MCTYLNMTNGMMKFQFSVYTGRIISRTYPQCMRYGLFFRFILRLFVQQVVNTIQYFLFFFLFLSKCFPNDLTWKSAIRGNYLGKMTKKMKKKTKVFLLNFMSRRWQSVHSAILCYRIALQYTYIYILRRINDLYISD